MKTIESIVLGLILIALALRFLNVPWGNNFTTLALMLAAAFYLFFGFALFLRIPLQGIFKASSYKNTTAFTLVGAIILGISFALILTGSLWKLQFRSGADTLLLTGILPATFIFGITAFIKNNYVAWFHQNIRQRVIGIVGMGAVLYFLI